MKIELIYHIISKRVIRTRLIHYLISDLSHQADMMILDLSHQADALHDIRPIENNKGDNYHIRTSEHSKIKVLIFPKKYKIMNSTSCQYVFV